MHEIEVSLQVKIGILGIEPKIVEQIIQTIDEKEVEKHC